MCSQYSIILEIVVRFLDSQYFRNFGNSCVFYHPQRPNCPLLSLVMRLEKQIPVAKVVISLSLESFSLGSEKTWDETITSNFELTKERLAQGDAYTMKCLEGQFKGKYFVMKFIQDDKVASLETLHITRSNMFGWRFKCRWSCTGCIDYSPN